MQMTIIWHVAICFDEEDKKEEKKRQEEEDH